MSGEQIKEILKKNGYQLNDIAEAMGETPQNLQSLLRASDIKTGVLERIAKAINKNLYFFIEDNASTNSINGNNNTAITGNGINIHSEVDKFIELLRKKDEQIDRLLTILENNK